jgi:hypothetical protein
MNVVTPRLPEGCRELFNALYPSRDPQLLTDDLYAAELPDGIFINVGWFPESDPAGAYEICVYLGEFDNLILKPIETDDLNQVVRRIEKIAADFAKGIESVPAATSSPVHPQTGLVSTSCLVGTSGLVSTSTVVSLHFREFCHA